MFFIPIVDFSKSRILNFVQVQPSDMVGGKAVFLQHLQLCGGGLEPLLHQLVPGRPVHGLRTDFTGLHQPPASRAFRRSLQPCLSQNDQVLHGDLRPFRDHPGLATQLFFVYSFTSFLGPAHQAQGNPESTGRVISEGPLRGS